jgi:hypothetical protein
MPVLPVGSMLSNIQQKVRRITGSPSLAQLSDNDLNQYINTFYTNDFPTAQKMFSLRTVLTFYTQPGVDVYKTNNIANDPLNDFQNKYTAVHPPVYIAGVQAFFTQDRTVFYGNWPQTNFVQQTGFFGNGTQGPFAGVLPPPVNQPSNFSTAIPHVLQGSVLFTCQDANGNDMILIDYPVSNTTGALGVPGVPQTLPSPYGQVNYVTGAFTATFPSNTAVSVPPQGNPVWSEAIYYVPGLPTTVLYYDNQFVFRPVPDKAYVVQVEANMVPTQFFETTDNPLIKQWWQYIAMGAAIKIFQDRRDYDSVNMIMPEFLNQQSLVLSTSMEQYTNQRSITIYTNNGIASGWNAWWNSWPY